MTEVEELGGSKIAYAIDAPKAPMKVVQGFPPNIEVIRSYFPLQGNELFAYGDTIYFPNGGDLPAALRAHEECHRDQQGKDVKAWWERYLIDSKWRFEQELEAHRVELATWTRHMKDRNMKTRLKNLVAHKLISPIYNYTPPVGLHEAIRLLK